MGALEIGNNIGQNALLRAGGLEGKNALNGVADAVFAHAKGDSFFFAMLLAAQRDSQLIEKEFLENQTQVRGAAELIERFQIGARRRKMHVHQSIVARRKLEALENIRRKRIGNRRGKILQHAVDNPAQHARAEAAHGFVNGNDAAHFRGIGFAFAGGIADQFKFRIDHLQARGAVRIDFHFAVQHDALQSLEAPLQIAAVKKDGVERPGIVAHGEMVKRAAAAMIREQPAGGDARQNRGRLSRLNLIDRREMDAVFVAKRKIIQQGADGFDAALDEQSGALRADAFQIFHRIVESNGHGV